MNILIVDDARFNLLALAKLCQTFLHHVTVTTSSAEAIQLLSAQHFDIVMTDFCMPELNGIDFLKACRKEVMTKSEQELPAFVLFSAYLDERLDVEALKAGFYTTLKKPITSTAIKKIFDDVKQGEHLIKAHQESILLLTPAGSNEERFFKSLAHQENYKLFVCHDVESAKERYEDIAVVSAVFVSAEATNLDVLSFYQWSVENKKVLPDGQIVVPPFCAMFQKGSFTDQPSLLNFLKGAKYAGIGRVINTTDNIIKVAELMRSEAFLNQNVHKPTVLVVEVSTFARNYIASVVEENGYAIKQASRIEEAMQLYAKDKNICLVLTDSQLPDGSAANLLKKIEATVRVGLDGELPAAKVVVTGTKPEINMTRDIKAQGFVDYVQKPLDNKKIKDILHNHLGPEQPQEGEEAVIEVEAEMQTSVIENSEMPA